MRLALAFFVLVAGALLGGCGGVSDDDDDATGDGDADADADADADGDADGDARRAAVLRYCDCMLANCSDTFSSEDECLVEAGSVPRVGRPGDDAGDSLECRAFHCQAAEFAPAVHCPHAAGAPPCAD